ncbi:hypothetical protein ACFP81_02500 [Deinococcus lacus]|uniref:Uncharacterized protein n=1 Tax=Deinococcus lacus TaxID=392561 RepID=A0ABW1Y9Y0_9DEIO
MDPVPTPTESLYLYELALEKRRQLAEEGLTPEEMDGLLLACLDYVWNSMTEAERTLVKRSH